MTEREAYEAIYQRMDDTWPGLQPAVPYTFDNEVFESAASWARVSVNHTVSQQVTMGAAPNRKFHRQGNVMVQLFSAANAGRGTLADLAASVRTVFEGQSLSGLHLYAASTNEVPTDGVWAMSVVVIPFRYSETR